MREVVLAMTELIGAARPSWEVRAEVDRAGVAWLPKSTAPDRVMVRSGARWVGVVCADCVRFDASLSVKSHGDGVLWGRLELSDPHLLDQVLERLDAVFSEFGRDVASGVAGR